MRPEEKWIQWPRWMSFSPLLSPLSTNVTAGSQTPHQSLPYSFLFTLNLQQEENGAVTIITIPSLPIHHMHKCMHMMSKVHKATMLLSMLRVLNTAVLHLLGNCPLQRATRHFRRVMRVSTGGCHAWLYTVYRYSTVLSWQSE